MKTLTIENGFVALNEEELTAVEGGLAPVIIGGVAIGWKVIGGVVGVVTAAGAVGVATGYYANRP
ncbi:class IIb bacteriocin, lactobin A/cerein 7B family [Streptococcus ruminantium]|uniref:Class IIb bacteriocin, lactobin A/cerein 7B family n=1 Tax=Streptococcus ruminantium TaxID=1917441 RepID=A0ABU1B294_9STRE|nr:class IIb bacteriocin, lactobin A/cerein 7B family [Streptococcus ruminantium]MDQ8759572.1 class IIb bacteriocin, lactobin A/cerein 7B family [Streptococcus ruminantium]MDQ8765882.1 class IIb bacteriocin, lactobin A/cerein 7B family [Streptococcus ruminantium]MDQ8768599.1 class IIb bacteriocin, lactobin A/cerein 7B family [Streptococcus ruminantium]MDQ8775026.1 class IIb bacteriocin, lactobin A/cerein 7B family [Streptococcus ruminantium]MDQ8793962.1 class IIb bacteriocin, lactobin A/cerein